MSSFLEKLKKGMGVKENEEQKSEQENKNRKIVNRKISSEKLQVKTDNNTEDLTKETLETKNQEETKKEKWFDSEGKPAIDIYETDNDLIIQSAIAGVKPEELDIYIENDRVVIKGQRNQPEEQRAKNYFYQECYWGPFSREIILPVETDPNRAEASMKQGILTITIPKIEREKKRKIEIK